LQNPPPPPNQPPIADAGADQTVNSGDTVTLDGSGSSDPDPEDQITYSWTQEHPVHPSLEVALDTSDPVHPTFKAPSPCAIVSSTSIVRTSSANAADG
jgi:PKD domain